MQSAAATKFSWKNEPELVARLTKLQNSPKYQSQDIMTFALGFSSSREELCANVRRMEGKHNPASPLINVYLLDRAEIDTARGVEIAWGR